MAATQVGSAKSLKGAGRGSPKTRRSDNDRISGQAERKGNHSGLC